MKIMFIFQTGTINCNGNIEDEYEEDDGEDGVGVKGMVSKSAVAVVLEWACKLLERPFTDVCRLARHLVVNNYVNALSTDAFTVLSAVSEGETLENNKLLLPRGQYSAIFVFDLLA